MKYFQGIRTPEEAHTRYRYWAERLHPDKPGGTTAAFQEMKEEYEEIRIVLKHLPTFGQNAQPVVVIQQTSFWNVVDTLARTVITTVPPEQLIKYGKEVAVFLKDLFDDTPKNTLPPSPDKEEK